jgi:hypothetical protein
MSTPHRTPVYKCIIPVEQPCSIGSSIFRSLFHRPGKKAQRLPYPAWPYIDQANQPCCLPTVMRGVFFVTHSIHLSDKIIERRAKEYLARQENIEPEVREGALAAVKAHQKYSRRLSKFHRSLPGMAHLEQPSIFFDPTPAPINLQDTKEYTAKVFEQYMQALIYGDFDHFMGHKDASSFAHEYGHRIAMVFDSGKALEELAYNSQMTLGALAVLEELPTEKIDELWEQFETIRGYIDELVKKFEPIEEIFATYVGLRLLPVDTRNKVEPLIKEELIKRGWDKVYEAFAKQCDTFADPLEMAIFICEPACRVLLQVHMDGLELLSIFLKIHRIIGLSIDVILERIEEKDANALDELGVEDFLELAACAESEVADVINLLLDDAHIPQELYWSASQALRDRRKERAKLITEAFRNNDLSDLVHKLSGCAPKITLIGSPANEFISFSVKSCGHEETDKLSPYARIFYESLAEQIQKESGSLVCPYGSVEFRKKCCGRGEELKRLYERLPEKNRKHITLPNCVRVR